MCAVYQSGMSRWIVLLLPNNSIQKKIDLTYFNYEDKKVSSPSPSHDVVSRSRAELQGRKMEATGQNQSQFLERGKSLVPTGIQTQYNQAHSLVVVSTKL